MHNFFIPEIPVIEKILRPAIVYVFLLIAFRFTGKRQVGQLTPFDLAVLLIISNILQNAMIGNDVSVGGGLIGAVTVFALNYLVIELTFRFKKARRLLDSTPMILVHNGHVLHENLKQERVTMDELLAALRRSGNVEFHNVRFAVLEENGAISVVLKTAM